MADVSPSVTVSLRRVPLPFYGKAFDVHSWLCWVRVTLHSHNWSGYNFRNKVENQKADYAYWIAVPSIHLEKTPMRDPNGAIDAMTDQNEYGDGMNSDEEGGNAMRNTGKQGQGNIGTTCQARAWVHGQSSGGTQGIGLLLEKEDQGSQRQPRRSYYRAHREVSRCCSKAMGKEQEWGM